MTSKKDNYWYKNFKESNHKKNDLDRRLNKHVPEMSRRESNIVMNEFVKYRKSQKADFAKAKEEEKHYKNKKMDSPSFLFYF